MIEAFSSEESATDTASSSSANQRRTFLVAEWRYLLMLNYEVPAELLLPLVPRGTELDLWEGDGEGRALVSVVGFRFLQTRVLGMRVPLHQDFDEVNLRFYIRRLMPDGVVRRGVAFVREVVPRRAIATVARLAYNEPYVCLPMRSAVPEGKKDSPGRVAYEWRTSQGWASVSATAVGSPELVKAGSQEEFITEHYWGYTPQRDGSTVEYQVHHPTWRVWSVEKAVISELVSGFYGERFEPYLRRPVYSALLAEGSPVSVYRPTHLRG